MSTMVFTPVPPWFTESTEKEGGELIICLSKSYISRSQEATSEADKETGHLPEILEFELHAGTI